MRIQLLTLLALLQICLVSCTDSVSSEYQSVETVNEASILLKNEFASHFEIREFPDYTTLTLIGKGGKSEKYALYKSAKDELKIPSGLHKIQVPLQNIASLSCVYTRAFYELGGLTHIKGIDAVKHHYLDEISTVFEKGELLELSMNNQLNLEKVLEMNPDGLFTYNIDEQDNHFDKIAKADIPVIFCTEYLENHPLGKAEWIKVFALFIGQEAKADSIYSQISQDYKELRASLILKEEGRKTVFCNAPFFDAWYLPMSNSFTAQFFKDAGLDYIWKDAEGEGNQSLSIEVILDKALDADLWLNSGTYTSYEDLAALDPRMTNFKAFKERTIFNTHKRTRTNFGNDFWEMGSLHPDLILKDLVAIAYPELVPNHEKVFYQALK